MTTEAWADLNRRAAAVPGGVPWVAGMLDENGQMVVGVSRGGAVTSVWGYRTSPRTGRPDLSHAGTRGILRAALGSPAIKTVEVTRGTEPFDVVHHLATVRPYRGEPLFARGATREQAEAAALVALAEARGQWGPG